MKKNLTLIIALLLSSALHAQNNEQKLDSKIQQIIVFLNKAQITRTATANISTGTSTLRFTELSPNIDVQSIQVKSAGDFTILSVKHEMNYLAVQAKQKGVEEIQVQQKLIQEKIETQNNALEVYRQEEAIMEKNQVINGTNSSLDVVKLQQVLDFEAARLTDLKKKEQDTRKQIEILNTELRKYNQQIADLNVNRSQPTGNILVTVSSKAPIQSVFTLNYVVDNASWYPTYDIRAKNVNSPITIGYKANVSQKTGEDWKNVKLILSTGNPSVSGNKPELAPYFLNFGMYSVNPNAPLTKITGIVRAREDGLPIPGVVVKIKGSTIASVTDANGRYSIQLLPGFQTLTFSSVGYVSTEAPATTAVVNVTLEPSSHELNEVVVNTAFGVAKSASSLGYDAKSITTKELTYTNPIAVTQVENQTNVEFNIDNPYSIPPDGKQYTVEINQRELPATYQYSVVPKLNTDVFLTAQLTDWNKYNYLSGEANLFFEGTYIGKSLIYTQATTDTLNLSLGVDKNIVVTRTLQKELSEKQVLSSNKKETRNWLVDIRNRKSGAINLMVEDQVPVSQNKDIEVEVQELTGGKMDKETGKVNWIMTLNPSDEKKLQLRYQVKYPKAQSVIVQ
jgi:hypothetical protein